jgi:ribosomal protein S18 acetylase RimI-like enzyme
VVSSLGEPTFAAASPLSGRGRAVLRAYMDDVVSRYYGRPATHDEVQAVLDDDPSDDLEPPAGLLLVVSSDELLVGCGGLRLLPERIGELKRIYVAPSARGRGIGAELVRRLEQAARGHDVRRLRLDTRSDLVEARRLYARLGFREVEPFNRDPYSEHWFEKTLEQPGLPACTTLGRGPRGGRRGMQ